MTDEITAYTDASLTNQIVSVDPNVINVSPNATTTYYIKVKKLGQTCYDSKPLTIDINNAPALDLLPLTVCLDETVNLFDLIQNTDSQIFYSFYEDATDAENEDNPISNILLADFSSKTIFVKARDNNTLCTQIKSETIVTAGDYPSLNDISVCDSSTGGVDVSTELNDQTALLLNGLDASDYEVSYYLNKTDQENKDNPLDPNIVFTENSWSRTVFVRIENTDLGCLNLDHFFTLNIYKQPSFEFLTQNPVVCIGEANGALLELDNPDSSYDFEWKNSNGETIGMGSTVEVFEPGSYSVTASIGNLSNCGETTKEIVVQGSETATVTNVTVNTDGNNNSILIDVAGIGDYSFQLDNGTPQNDALFENLNEGSYSVNIIDNNGCGTTTIENINIMVVPQFMTPNGDGINDTWTIYVNATNYKTVQLLVYNRFGELMTDLSPTGNETITKVWYGTINGEPVPPNDYWYSLKLVGLDGKMTEHIGHFSINNK